MTEHLQAFRRHLAERGYRELTARSYRDRAAGFHAWLGDRPLTEDALRQYRAELRTRTCAPSTIRGSLAALSLWFAFLQGRRLASGLPAVPPPLEAHESRQGQRPRSRHSEGEPSPERARLPFPVSRQQKASANLIG